MELVWDVFLFLVGVDTPAADDDALDDDIINKYNRGEQEMYGSIIYGKANIKLYDHR